MKMKIEESLDEEDGCAQFGVLKEKQWSQDDSEETRSET